MIAPMPWFVSRGNVPTDPPSSDFGGLFFGGVGDRKLDEERGSGST